jgi:hypothetical protein
MTLDVINHLQVIIIVLTFEAAIDMKYKYKLYLVLLYANSIFGLRALHLNYPIIINEMLIIKFMAENIIWPSFVLEILSHADHKKSRGKGIGCAFID